jgi:hypothetical protein
MGELLAGFMIGHSVSSKKDDDIDIKVSHVKKAAISRRI